MKRLLNLTFVVAILVGNTQLFGQQWERTYSDGNNNGVRFRSVRQTSDGGYVFFGNYHHPVNDGQFYVVKVDANGIQEWENINGQTLYEDEVDIIQTQDNGYVAVGKTGTVGGKIVKYDQLGNVVWDLSQPNDGNGGAFSVVELADESLVVWGSSSGPGAQGGYDGYLTKHDPQGNVVWSRLYGHASSWDQGRVIHQTNDGGFILSGYYQNTSTLWLMKVDVNGIEEWSRTFYHAGGAAYSQRVLITNTGYLVSSTGSSGKIHLYSTDALGNMQWTSDVGEAGDELRGNIIHAHGGGYMTIGTSTRFGLGGQDLVMIKIDANGQEEWTMPFGGWARDRGKSIRATPDGGYILAGDTRSFSFNGETEGYGIKLGPNDLPCPVAFQAPTICDGEFFTVGLVTYSQTGVYTDTIGSVGGCDSIVVTDLTVVMEDTVVLVQNICDGSSFTVGSSTYWQTGTYWDVLTSVAGCDSTVQLELNVLTDLDTTEYHHLCQGDQWSWVQGFYQTYPDTGVFSIDFPEWTPEGCAYTRTVSLIVHPAYDTTITATICDGESFSVGTYTHTQTGVYQDVFPIEYGCDSIVNVNLTVLPSPDTTFFGQICNGDSFTVGTQTYTSSGVYYQHFTAANGCDSTVTVDLTVIDEAPFVINQSICDGDSFTVGSSTYTTPGTYTDVLTSSLGCDSTVVTELSFYPNLDTVVFQHYCQGEPGWYEFDPPGLYVTDLPQQSPDGCIYTVTVNRYIHPVYDTTITATICDGETFSVGTYTHTETGIYHDLFYATGVCDSTIHVNLTVLPSPDTTINASICIGQSFSVGTYTYSAGGTYTQQHISSNGCDSTITINITENQGFEVDQLEMICDGDVFTVGSSTYTQPGIYVDSLVSVGGCDSVITTEIVWSLDSPLGYPVTVLQGNVYHDQDGNCEFSAGDVPLDNWIIEAAGNQTYYGTTNSNGDYSVILPHGNYDLSAQTPVNWQHCGISPTSVSVNGNTGCYAQADIGLEPTFQCAILELDLDIICLVPCSTSTYHLNYQNIGNSTAYNPTITFAAGPYISVDWASEPWSLPQSGTIYEFELDSVPAGASGWIAIAVTMDCDTGLLGYSVCSGALHDAAQCCDVYAQYNGPEIELEAECQNNNEVQFLIKNVGQGDMTDPREYFILQDDIVYLQGEFMLNSLENLPISVQATGNTYRLEAEQAPSHPYAVPQALEVEGCGSNGQGSVSLGYVDMLEGGDPTPSIDFNCTEVTEDCNCNMLISSPTGVDEPNFISPEDQIEYVITFQNQFPVDANQVKVIDTLPPFIEPLSIIMGVGSHDFEFSVSEQGIVQWTMNDINLEFGTPGQNENAGFVKFTANLKDDVPNGTVIVNQAEIYFDGVIGAKTNEVFHTVGEQFVDFLIPLSVEDIVDPEHELHVFPNPFHESATIELQGIIADQVYVELYDINGRLAQRTNATSGNVVRVQRDGLNKGTYLYKVYVDGELFGTGKLVVGAGR